MAGSSRRMFGGVPNSGVAPIPGTVRRRVVDEGIVTAVTRGSFIDWPSSTASRSTTPSGSGSVTAPRRTSDSSARPARRPPTSLVVCPYCRHGCRQATRQPDPLPNHSEKESGALTAVPSRMPSADSATGWPVGAWLQTCTSLGAPRWHLPTTRAGQLVTSAAREVGRRTRRPRVCPSRGSSPQAGAVSRYPAAWVRKRSA